MSKDEIERLYQQNEKLVLKLAHWARRRYGGEFDEWKQAASEGFVEACNSFKAGRGASVSTWIYWKTVKRLQFYGTRRYMDRNLFVPLTELVSIPYCLPEESETRYLREQAAQLRDCLPCSDDARTVVGLCLDAPKEIIEMSKRSQVTKRGVAAFLSRQGWTKERIRDAFESVRVSFG